MKKNLIIFALFLVQWVQAATYYIDFATGSDANNGTSTATPWKHEPGDVNATGTADATTLAAGDRVKFKGGIVYTGEVIIARSGSLGNPITYDGNLLGDWGTGRAIIDRAFGLNAVGMTINTTVSHIDILHFAFQHAGDYADDATNVISAAAGTYTNNVNTGGVGINGYLKFNTNIAIGSCTFTRMGGWRNSTGWTQNSIQGAGIAMRDCQNVIITNCEMTKLKTAIVIAGGSWGARNVLIHSNNIHNYIVWGIDLATEQSSLTMENITNSFNQIHDYAEFNSGNWTGVEGTVGGSPVSYPHTDGIFVRTAGQPGTWTNIHIFKNQFYCDVNPGNGGTASIFVSQGPSCNIYSNLFNSDSHTRQIGVAYANGNPAPQRVYITNNTFIALTCIITDTETAATNRYVYIQNNIFRQPPGTPPNNINYVMVSQGDGTPPAILNNNLYYDPDNGVGTKYIGYLSSAGYSTFAVAQSNGWEANGVYSDPLFVSYVTTPSSRDTRLSASSPARGLAQDGGDAGWLPYEALSPSVGAVISSGIPNSKADF